MEFPNFLVKCIKYKKVVFLFSYKLTLLILSIPILLLLEESMTGKKRYTIQRIIIMYTYYIKITHMIIYNS